MSLAVEICFPLGRYHATPWDRHVNEGAVEWPPSPWRLTRALVAVWKERCPHLSEADVVAALEAISASPTYLVPRWTSSATRHYYPPNDHGSPDKVVDAFVALEATTPLVITWPEPELSSGARSALAELFGTLPFLGRADSICEARLVDSPASVSDAQELHPDEVGGLRVAVPRTPLDLDALTIGTDAMRKARLRQPPGMAHVSYGEPVADDGRGSRTRRPSSSPGSTRALVFAVAGKPPPSHLLAVAVADTFFDAAQSRFQKLTGTRPTPTLTGHSPDGDHPRSDQHQHMHVFVLPGSDGLNLISRLVIWAGEGFDATEAAVLGQLSELRLSKRRDADGEQRDRSVVRGFGPTRIQLVQLGAVEDVAPELCGRPAARWSSITPFLPTQHQKARRFSGARAGEYFVSFLTEELQRELDHRGHGARLVGPVRVVSDAERATPAQRYRRYRLQHGMRSARAGVWLEFETDREIGGPIALGALSHFGLGLFRPS